MSDGAYPPGVTDADIWPLGPDDCPACGDHIHPLHGCACDPRCPDCEGDHRPDDPCRPEVIP